MLDDKLLVTWSDSNSKQTYSHLIHKFSVIGLFFIAHVSVSRWVDTWHVDVANTAFSVLTLLLGISKSLQFVKIE